LSNYGKFITEKREERGYSQRKLSMVSGVSNTTIWRMERGETKKPEIESLKAIEKALGLAENTIVDIAYPPANNDCSSLEEKYPEVHDIEEAMQVLLAQPGLMLKGEILDDEDKIILANAIQMGLRLAEDMKKKNKDKGK